MGLLDDAVRDLERATAKEEETRRWMHERGGNLWSLYPNVLSPEVQEVVRDLFARTPGEACYAGRAPDGHYYFTTAPLTVQPEGMTPARRLTMPSDTPSTDGPRSMIRLALSDSDEIIWSDAMFHKSAKEFATFAAEYLLTLAATPQPEEPQPEEPPVQDRRSQPG